jgi:hypothetical protein
MSAANEPSTYAASINLSYQEIWELQKAIAERVCTLIKRGDSGSDSMEWLMQVSLVLDTHIENAVSEWEEKVAHSEAAELNDEEALRKFLSED